ncbi:MAG: glucose-6-phosphate dehydrogenase assembly protein OpcA [Candidatus Didemnitutus sp.]|nr:glucose-6-phosphate dehydrogenase assembly protein OpcA [Candidatus Didemnitutus sp.]
MSAIFQILPGMEVPVGEIDRGFTRLWNNTDAQDQRAMQLNLVVHFGLNSTPEDAEIQFRHTVQFAQRYPCRVVVLCPARDPAAPREFRAKIYGECFLGKSGKDTRCCEFVMLGYPVGTHDYLQNQVSICLSNDLPLYYWAHRFSSNNRLAAYDYLLTKSRRVLFDSAVVPADAFTFPWPNPAAVRDLAYTRTRPLRQTLGQFLSRYSPDEIIAGLRGVTLRHEAKLSAEAAAMLGWLKKGLMRCEGKVEEIQFTAEVCDGSGCFAIHFDYSDAAKDFSWSADLSANHAEFSGNLGHGSTTLVAGARLLEPAEALSEAMFY